MLKLTDFEDASFPQENKVFWLPFVAKNSTLKLTHFPPQKGP